jgi:hypothetical protein
MRHGQGAAHYGAAQSFGGHRHEAAFHEGDLGAHLTKLDQDQEQRPNNFHTMSLSILILLPVFIFFVNSLCYVYARDAPALTMIVMLMCFGLSALFMALKTTRPGAPMYWFNLGFLCFLACAVSTGLGKNNYTRWLDQYYEYEGQSEYTNVVPSLPATAYLDAGKIVFSKDSHVDVSKFASHVHEGTTYCAAPVVSSAQSAATTAFGFWAAGLNCCSGGNFTCDGALNKEANAGLVYLHAGDLAQFALATSESSAKRSEDVLFVKWVDDVDKAESLPFNAAVGYLFGSTSLYMVFSIMVGFVVHFGQRRQPARKDSDWSL